MNKKVSTLLTVGLMLGGSLLSSSAFAQETAVDLDLTKADTKLDSYYYVGLADKSAYLTLNEVKDDANNKEYTSLTGVAAGNDFSTVLAEGDKALFSVKIVTAGTARYFELVNKETGESVVFNATETLNADNLKMVKSNQLPAEGDKLVSTISAANFTTSGAKMVPYHGGTTANTNELNLAIGNVTMQLASPGGTNLVFYSVDDASVGASAFSDKKGEFTLEYKIGNDAATQNVFKSVRAIDVKAGGKYVAGTYFVVDAPSDLKDEYDADDADDLRKLNQLTFLAVDSENDWNINKLDATEGEGMKFVEIRGTRLVASDDAEAGDIATENACFSVFTSANQEGKVKLTVSPYVNNEDGDALVQKSGLLVAAIEDKDDIHVTTVSSSNPSTKVEWTTIASSNLVEVKDFLDSEDAKVFNIRFISTTGSIEGDKTESEYNKYLGYGGESTSGLVAQGKDFVNLDAPQNQWIIIDADKDNNTFTFANRETGEKIETALVKTDKDLQYKLTEVSGNFKYAFVNAAGIKKLSSNSVNFEGTSVELEPITVNPLAGYVSTELDKLGAVKMSFTIESAINPIELFVTGEDDDEALNKDLSKAALFEINKLTEEGDTIVQYNDYAVWNSSDKKVEYKEKADTIAVVTYAFNELGTKKYLDHDLVIESAETAEATDAPRFAIKMNADKSYSLIPVVLGDDVADMTNNDTYAVDGLTSASVSAVTGKIATDENIYTDKLAFFTISGQELGTSLNHVPQHVTMKDAKLGAYLAVAENGNGIVAPVSELRADYAKADLTFWLDTTDTDAHVPAFYITKGGKEFMYNAADSADYYNDGIASAEENKDYYLPTSDDNTKYPRAIFRSATLKDANTLVTTIDDKEKELTAENGLNAYKFNIVENEDGDYVVYNVAEGTYLFNQNGELGFTKDAVKAMALVIETAEAPTANEAISATDVKVIALDGAVNVKNAAGKNVVVSTILGQIVANEVLTSDNATISVPAGIAIVSVDGEEAVKVSVK